MSHTPDSSVLIAALATWHARHADARGALGGVQGVIGHALVETFSVLTRLPAPYRIAAPDASAAIAGLPWPTVVLPGSDVASLVTGAANMGLRGGAVYDALIAATALHHGLSLLTLDVRARKTYDLVGVPVRTL